MCEAESVLGQALGDPMDRQNAATERFGRPLFRRQKFRRCRDVERLQIVAAEAYTGRVRYGQRHNQIDDAVRSVAHDSTAGEECGPNSPIDIHAGAIRSIA